MESLHESLSEISNFTEGGDVNTGNTTTASNKLDVMTSKQFNRLTVINIFLGVYTIVHVVFLSVACSTVWNEQGHTNVNGNEIEISICRAPKAYMAPLYVIDNIGRIGLIFLCVVFTVRISRTKVRKTREQVWTLIMVIMAAISYNPSYSVVYLHDRVLVQHQNMWLVKHKWLTKYILVTRTSTLTASSVGQLFYIWACSHTYGILDINDQPSNLRFYGPKILLLTIYTAYRGFFVISFGIAPSKLPLSTLFALFADFRALKIWDTKVFIVVGVYALIELTFVMAIIRRMCITANVLRKAPYVKHRGKQIGFRYFVMANVIAYALFFCADCSLLIAVSRGYELVTVYDVDNFIKRFLYNIQFGPVPRLLNYATTAMAAYVNLPADSVGLMGWFKGSDRNEEDELEPITLRAASKKSDFIGNRMSSLILFDLLVELFNFSDIAYLKKSSAIKNRRATKYTDERGYSLEFEIFNELNETYATVFTNDERIIVAFKGTTTRENMKTDLHVRMVKLSTVLPTKKVSTHNLLSSLDWKNSRIHKGFGAAYSSVSDELISNIANLYGKKERLICFTGHSLGASLATIASLDVSLSLNIKDVYVVTFGSPRCGDIFWSRACDQVVPAHWRVAMRSDIVTTLPRAGYTHTGKRVALTKSGEVFLDPNAIETILWSSAGVNASDHAKPAYKKALILFAEKYLPSFIPEFVSDAAEESE